VWRLASDIGGTFTDLVYFNEATGDLGTAKSLTTPRELTQGVIETIRLSQIDPGEVGFFVHGGTTVINVITERKGAKTALITTAGFRDVLEIARGNRPDLYNLRFEKEPPIVRRRYRFEVRERVDARGKELEPLHLEDLDPIIAQCRSEGIEAIAIQFLHSYAAPEHEAVCAAYLRERLPEVAVTASNEITREWREYERASTAVLNAYVQPIVQKYFAQFQSALAGVGIRCLFSAMQSNGGTTSFEWAKEHPITLIESGPAAGVNGGVLIGRLCREPNIIYLDIGGTTAKCSTIEDGQPKVTTEYKLEHDRNRFGYPVRVPVVDIVEIGAGGGSIAWFDAAGLLRVGPVSAGADPGPACYALGGEEPTVTDAKLITGVLNPDYFAAGRLKLDVERARKAMRKIADGLGTDVMEAAIAVIRVVDASMIEALKLVSIQRGHDPRDFALVVGGGGGAMHAGALGRELGVKAIIVPLYPGLFSAWGMLVTEPRRDFTQTSLCRAESIGIHDIRELFSRLRQEARESLRTDQRAAEKELTFEYRIDLRYLGQEHSVTVPVSIERATVESILRDFHDVHERVYTFRLPESPVEFVTFRLTAIERVPRPQLGRISADGRSAQAARKGQRIIEFPEEGRHEAVVLERELLPPDFTASGPLIIEEPSSTTLIHPGQQLRVGNLGFLHITET
jgi:N-methylhydantoinase A